MGDFGGGVEGGFEGVAAGLGTGHLPAKEAVYRERAMAGSRPAMTE
jgi:outer membrane lipoprotein SlyB